MWAVEVSGGGKRFGVCDPVEDWDVRFVGMGLDRVGDEDWGGE